VRINRNENHPAHAGAGFTAALGLDLNLTLRFKITEALAGVGRRCYIKWMNTLNAMKIEACCCAGMCCAHVFSGVRKWLS
jgi:hypothetical protein